MSDAELNAIVVQRIEVAPGLIVLRVAPDGWRYPVFEPGQFAVLWLPGPEEEGAKPVKRAYSIASAPTDDAVELYVALVPDGRLTPRLFALGIGDRVGLGVKPSGKFTLEGIPDRRRIVLVSTGTGLAPYMSMLRSDRLGGPGRRYLVLHGVRQSCDLGYRAELQAMARFSPAIDYLPIVSRPAGEPVPWPGLTGHVQAAWTGGAIALALGTPPSPDDTSIFLCGNPAMIESMVELLATEGYREHKKTAPGQVHVERYW